MIGADRRRGLDGRTPVVCDDVLLIGALVGLLLFAGPVAINAVFTIGEPMLAWELVSSADDLCSRNWAVYQLYRRWSRLQITM